MITGIVVIREVGEEVALDELTVPVTVILVSGWGGGARRAVANTREGPPSIISG
jgi:hypothetical protein